MRRPIWTDLETAKAVLHLIEAGFLYEHEVYPERVLAFRHPLTREVAYGTQLGEQRTATHAAVARATNGADSARA